MGARGWWGCAVGAPLSHPVNCASTHTHTHTYTHTHTHTQHSRVKDTLQRTSVTRNATLLMLASCRLLDECQMPQMLLLIAVLTLVHVFFSAEVM